MISKPGNTGFCLDGKTALVTGGASGIGFAVAKLFTQKGATVCLVDINKKKAELAANSLSGAMAFQADVSDKKSVEKLVSDVIEKNKRIDVLVNSAGVGDIDWAESISEQTWRKVIDINLTGTFLVCQCVGRRMIEQGNGGKIVSVASQAGIVAIDKHVAYSASKAGVISMTKSLAYEWGKYGIQVNAVSPTSTETPMIVGYWDEPQRYKETIKNLPAGRFCKPEEVAAAILFLSSESSNMITGENLVIDGGYTIH